MSHHIPFIQPTPLQIGLVLVMISILTFGSCPYAKADEPLPSSAPDISSVVRAHSNQLAKIESDKEASNLFVSTIGPALQMGDVARTLQTNPLPTKFANELLLPDLTAAVLRLMGNLTAWHLASTIRQAVRERHLVVVTERLFGSPHAKAWLDQQEKAPWHESLYELSGIVASPEWAKGNQGESPSTLLVTVIDQASRLEADAMQAGYQEWDRIRSWKDRVRMLRGQARLCGTWQWIIHSHQHNHREQKLSILFPPAGNAQALPPGLAETVVLGDNVYLRWEFNGLVQEDSLQFNKEGQRLEGTFVNSQGGWGSISGKRTVSCMP